VAHANAAVLAINCWNNGRGQCTGSIAKEKSDIFWVRQGWFKNSGIFYWERVSEKRGAGRKRKSVQGSKEEV